MHYGGDYNPEQWEEATWREDVALMREAGVTMVSVGIFAWSRIQPAEGRFDWDWLDTVLDLLHEGGIAADLATATASPPPWATAAYPGMHARDADGSIFWHGSRQHYAPTSPEYRRLAGELVHALAQRYASHPAVVMWHVNNEYGCHLHYDYSDHARDAFRDWLRQRYGSIESLNRAWGTDFWSQRYTDFDQIVPPRKAPYSHNPSGLVDFKRFTSDALLELFTMEKQILREHGATQPVTTNFMGAFPPADYRRWAREIDVITDDNYADPNDPESFRSAAFSRDLMRSLKPGVPWILTEQATSAVNWRPSNAPKAPGQMAALSMQAVARGADGIMFFQWRQSRRGSEKFHSAMLPHAGRQTRTWREVTELGSVLAALPTLPAGPSGARVALIFDWENWWAIGNPDHPVRLDYAHLVQRWYSALHRQHVSVDIRGPEEDLSGYGLVVVPQLYLVSDAAAANLNRYVADGGHLFVSSFTDVVDSDDAFRDGGFTTVLGPILGMRVDDFGALVAPAGPAGVDSAGGALDGPPSPAGPGQRHATVSTPLGPVVGQYFAEELRVLDATVVGTFTDGRSARWPALTTRVSGAGQAHYLATIPDDPGMTTVLRWALDRAVIAPELPGLPECVEVARRGSVLTVINHGAYPVSLSLPGSNLLTGDPLDDVTLAPFAWVMTDQPTLEEK
ncbi:beta-galactosidase [Nakamurella deserti]|uniref:beta-galactosidase n=1 Tax=Nakamurella deserti TaxID=2164074 RepID=UPI000DBE5E34|nr:beta-galactosidase [Nakamurella deserti]